MKRTAKQKVSETSPWQFSVGWIMRWTFMAAVAVTVTLPLLPQLSAYQRTLFFTVLAAQVVISLVASAYKAGKLRAHLQEYGKILLEGTRCDGDGNVISTNTSPNKVQDWVTLFASMTVCILLALFAAIILDERPLFGLLIVAPAILGAYLRAATSFQEWSTAIQFTERGVTVGRSHIPWRRVQSVERVSSSKRTEMPRQEESEEPLSITMDAGFVLFVRVDGSQFTRASKLLASQPWATKLRTDEYHH